MGYKPFYLKVISIHATIHIPFIHSPPLLYKKNTVSINSRAYYYLQYLQTKLFTMHKIKLNRTCGRIKVMLAVCTFLYGDYL